MNSYALVFILFIVHFPFESTEGACLPSVTENRTFYIENVNHTGKVIRCTNINDQLLLGYYSHHDSSNRLALKKVGNSSSVLVIYCLNWNTGVFTAYSPVNVTANKFTNDLNQLVITGEDAGDGTCQLFMSIDESEPPMALFYNPNTSHVELKNVPVEKEAIDLWKFYSQGDLYEEEKRALNNLTVMPKLIEKIENIGVDGHGNKQTSDCSRPFWKTIDVCSKWSNCSNIHFNSRKELFFMFSNKDNVTCQKDRQNGRCGDLVPCSPMEKTLQITSKVLLSMGCGWVIGTTSTSNFLLFFAKSYSYKRWLQVGQEVCLSLGHAVILTSAARVDLKAICSETSAVLEFLFTSNACFLMFESLHTYAVISSVIPNGSFIRIIPTVLLCLEFLGVPGLFAALIMVVYLTRGNGFIYSCWVQYDSSVNTSLALAPMIVICSLAMILSEEATRWNHKPLPDADKTLFSEAQISKRTLFLKVMLNFASWFTTSYALYFQRFALFPIAFFINVALGWTVFTAHVLETPVLERVQDFVKRIFKC